MNSKQLNFTDVIFVRLASNVVKIMIPKEPMRESAFVIKAYIFDHLRNKLETFNVKTLQIF